MTNENNGDKELIAAYEKLVKYFKTLEGVNNSENGKWFKFTVWVHKMDDKSFSFVHPCLEINSDPREDEIVVRRDTEC